MFILMSRQCTSHTFTQPLLSIKMSHEENSLLIPTVLWAQRKEMVLLRILIQPSEVIQQHK